MTKGDAPNLIQATKDHLEAVAALFDDYRQFYDQKPDLKRARDYIAGRMANRDSTIFLAMIGDRPAGFVQLYPTFCSVEAMPIWVLYDLFVAAPFRRSGVGEALMNRATELARESGASRIDLSTAVDNRQAQRLYERLGYQRDREFYVYSLAIA